MSLQADLHYPFDEDGWYKTIGIGMVFEYLTFLVIPGLFLAGYYIRVMRETAAGEEEPPEFGDYGELTVDGIKAFLILFVYFLVPVVVAWLTYIPALLGIIQGNFEGAIASLLVGMLASFAVTLLFAYGGIAGLVNFAHTGSMRAAFSPSLLGVISSGAWFKAWLKVLVTGGISFVFTAAFAVIPPALIAHVVLIPFQVKYFFTVYARIFSRAYATAAGTAGVAAATAQPTGRHSADAPDADAPEAPTAAAESPGSPESARATESAGTETAGSESTSERSNPLEEPARRLQQPADAASVTDGVERLSATIETIVERTDAVQRGIVDPDSTPVEQAQAIRTAADGGTLVPEADTAEEHTIAEGETETPALTDAVNDASQRAAPRTDTGRELVDALERADEVGEQQMTEALRNAIETLDRGESLSSTLADIKPASDRREIARVLEQGGGTIGGDVGTGLTTVADELSGVAADLETQRSERQRLATNAETLCDTATDQTPLALDTTASADKQLEALSDRLRDGTVAFTDRERSMDRLATNVERRVRPESTLSAEFLRTIRGESMDADGRERTIADALEAIDSTETLRHRLEGVSPDDVGRLADRLTGELSGVDTPGSEQLADRVENLQQLVSKAGESDRMTVYAARQELRFYDRQLLEALEGTTDRSHSEAAVRELHENVEQRRSEMRTQYPSSYPDHDHSIPIHFLELVPALQESAEEARAAGDLERAVGYLQAADRTLDWVTELYDRQAYSSLLEQLRG